MIKGFVLGELSTLINKILNSTNLTKALLSSIYHDLFNETWNIWTRRCDSFKHWKIQQNISDSYKTDFNLWASSGFPSTSHIIPPILPTSLIHSVNLGANWSNFWSGSNHAPIAGWSILFNFL